MNYNFILYKKLFITYWLLKKKILSNIKLFLYIFKDSKCFTSSKNF